MVPDLLLFNGVLIATARRRQAYDIPFLPRCRSCSIVMKSLR